MIKNQRFREKIMKKDLPKGKPLFECYSWWLSGIK